MPLPRRLRRILCVLLAFGLLPGWAILMENIEHLVHDGHLAHAAHDVAEAEHEDTREHGCAPAAHTCGCHSGWTLVADAPVLPHDPGALPHAERAPPDLVASLRSRSDPPPTRPPIA